MWQDKINGLYEFLGGFFILLSIVKIWRDKQVHGVSWLHVLFFATWGYWNLYYYPCLGQWHSFLGGLGIVIASSAWLALLVYYSYKKATNLAPIKIGLQPYRLLNLLTIDVEDISIYDIARTLSHICRYGGRGLEFYSVAEHSYRASLVAEEFGVDPILVLLHDAAEMFIGDIVGVYKRDVSLRGVPITQLEDRLMGTIYKAFGLTCTPKDKAIIHTIDMRIRRAEALCLKIQLIEPDTVVEPLPIVIEPMTPVEAMAHFLYRASELNLC